jgi:hypothetical protein
VVVVVPQFVHDKSFCVFPELLFALFGLLLLLLLFVISSFPVQMLLTEDSAMSADEAASGDELPMLIFFEGGSCMPDRLGHDCFRRPVCF